MMPVIRVSDRTWTRLKGYARPLEDNADDVVNLALDALDASRKAGATIERTTKEPVKRVRRGGLLPQRAFRDPLLHVLIKLGGSASVQDVRKHLEPVMAPLLGPADYEPVSTGDPRWWNAACWERSDMVKDRILKDNSRRGVWEINDTDDA